MKEKINSPPDQVKQIPVPLSEKVQKNNLISNQQNTQHVAKT